MKNRSDWWLMRRVLLRAASVNILVPVSRSRSPNRGSGGLPLSLETALSKTCINTFILFINKVDPFTFTVGAVRKIRTGRVRQRRKAKGTKPPMQYVPSPQLAYQLITIF